MKMENKKQPKATEKELLEQLRKCAKKLEKLNFKLDIQMLRGDMEGSLRTTKALRIGRNHFYKLTRQHKKLWRKRRKLSG